MFWRFKRINTIACASLVSSSFSWNSFTNSDATQPSFGATVNLKREKKNKSNEQTHKNILLIQGSAHKKLADEISQLIDVPVADVNISRFADGEVAVQINDSIRDKNIFIVQTCSSPVNDNVMELLLTISCARRSGARRINAVIPYFGYKHHRRGSPISTKHGSRFLSSGAMDFAKMLTEMGVDRVISVDLQRPGQGSEACFFDNTVPLESIGTSQFQMDFITEYVAFSKTVVVVAPNAECVKKARQCQGMLQKKLGHEVKMSSFFQADSSSGPTDPVKLQLLDGTSKFQGADVILVDDMLDSGGTLKVLAERIKEAGANRIYACASHGLFTENAMENIDNCPVDKVFVTDTLPLPSPCSEKIVQMPIAPMLARVILAEHFRTISEASDSFEVDDLTSDS